MGRLSETVRAILTTRLSDRFKGKPGNFATDIQAARPPEGKKGGIIGGQHNL